MVQRDVLLDTGPLVALLNRRDEWHKAIVDLFPSLIDRLVTTEAVITEATHLTGRAKRASLPLEFVLDAGIPIAPLSVDGYRRCAVLMQKYSSTPMDFADATLVTIADPLSIDTVFTLDRKGFASYRGARARRFTIVDRSGS